MESNQQNSGLGSSATGYNPGRDVGQGVDDRTRTEPGAGRSAEGTRFSKEPIKAAKEVAKEGTRAAREVGNEVKQQAKSVVQELKGSADEFIEKNRERATGQAHTVSRMLHRVADEFEQDPDAKPLVGITAAIANRVDDVADWIERREPREILRSVEDFARREPVLFLGGALLVGLVASRFLKASQHRSGTGRDDRWEHEDSAGNRGSSAPIDDRMPRGPLDNSGLGMPSATPLDVTRPGDSRPDIRRDVPTDMGPGNGGGV